jgi:acetoacetyl-CoA synthetase
VQSVLTQFIAYLESKDLSFKDYQGLHHWSINEIGPFWESIATFFDISFSKKYTLSYKPGTDFKDAKWFSGAKISYAHHVFRQSNDDFPAIKYQEEFSEYQEISWNALTQKTLEFQKILIQNNVHFGDRVVAYCCNTPESIAAFLAVNSLGAIWSSCSPEFGLDAVLDRFDSLRPTFLFYNSAYYYNGKSIDINSTIEKLKDNLLSLNAYLDLNNHQSFHFKAKSVQIKFRAVPFDHPIWILFTSGTTGKPKAITHRTGGIILEHFKALAIHQNVKQKENYFWYSTTGWMMWNFALSSLLLGSTLCIYNGSPNYPDNGTLWRFADRANINHFGHGASYYEGILEKLPKELINHHLNALKTIGSTGSPLYPKTYHELDKIFSNQKIISVSGGTDICSAFIGGNPDLAIIPGEIQCKMLGAAVEVWDDRGKKLLNKMGELVLTQPLPSMPVFLWDDPNFKKYRESYFSKYETVWNHGDWASETFNAGFIIHGRSDSTLNRFGVRIGSSEIYKVVNQLPEVQDSLVIHLKDENSDRLILFVKTKIFIENDAIKIIIRNKCSPRHVPDEIFNIPEIPYTISGKKIETPIKRILMGAEVDKVISKDSLRNPTAIDYFKKFKSLF